MQQQQQQPTAAAARPLVVTHNRPEDMPAPDHAPDDLVLPVVYNFLTIQHPTVVLVPPDESLIRMLKTCRSQTVFGGLWKTLEKSIDVVYQDGMKQVTALLTTPEGRLQAREQQIRTLPNLVLVTLNLVQLADIFDGSHQATLWVWFRHPVQRQIEDYFAQPPQSLSLAEWAVTIPPNPMLTALLSTPLNKNEWSMDDVQLAKHLIRTRARIGIDVYKAESLRKYQVVASAECVEPWLVQRPPTAVGTKSRAFYILSQHHALDLRLYHYALRLFHPIV
jgi:hypothetical protein